MILMIVVLSCFSSEAEAQVVDVAPVWAGHPVGFCLLTQPPHQFVAFYDANRQMTVAQRTLDSTEWTFTYLPEHVGWDSHNSITMIIDDSDQLHLTGNMHGDPLKNFRTTRPLDSKSFERVESMVGENEQRATYPHFVRGPDDQLLFTYRDGGSGNGNQIWNAYNLETQRWSRLLDKPLVDGRGKMNAYFNGPLQGPDGYWHLSWVWRDTPDCATNHDPSYARSRDLVHWERSDGPPLLLPITFETAEIVDSVPSGGGVINGNVRLGFDAQNRVTVAYHKYDENGFTQTYLARRENDEWKKYRITDWDYRWNFSGNGSIGTFEVGVHPLEVENGRPVLAWRHAKFGSQRWRLDADTLKPVERLPNPPSKIPAELRKVRSTFPGVGVRFRDDSGRAESDGVTYVLRWETLGANRDRPRAKPWPAPSTLQVIRIQE
ncbi:MAG: BNR repeat-containing protein [Candidatus Hydrogenedentota bacterium]